MTLQRYKLQEWLYGISHGGHICQKPCAASHPLQLGPLSYCCSLYPQFLSLECQLIALSCNHVLSPLVADTVQVLLCYHPYLVSSCLCGVWQYYHIKSQDIKRSSEGGPEGRFEHLKDHQHEQHCEQLVS